MEVGYRTVNHSKRVFLSFLDSEYSRSGVVFQGKRSQDVFVQLSYTPKEIIKSVRLLKYTIDPREAVVIVMSPSHLLVPYLKIFTKFSVVLDAGWPLSDASTFEKKLLRKWTSKLLSFLIDITSFHFCDLLILESTQQLPRVAQKFFLPKKKLSVRLTGLNELAFDSVQAVRPIELTLDVCEKKIILFRGKDNPESGLPLVISLQELIRPDWILVIVTNKPIRNVDPSKTILISRHVSNGEIRWLYENAQLSLGQMSNNSRLSYTIPHKAFESAYFGVPYVSPEHEVLKELFCTSRNYLSLQALSRQSVIEKIERVIDDVDALNLLRENSLKSYFENASQSALHKKFESTLNNYL